MEEKHTTRRELYLKKIEAAEKIDKIIEKIGDKIFKQADDGRLILQSVDCDEFERLIEQLKRAEEEYRSATEKFLKCMEMVDNE